MSEWKGNDCFHQIYVCAMRLVLLCTIHGQLKQVKKGGGKKKSEQYEKYDEGEQQMRLIANRLKDTILCQHGAEKFDVQARRK